MIQHHLADACAIAQIKKNKVAVVAAAVHPAHHDNVFACIGCAQVAAEMRPFEIA
jgi:hypothetical protein